MRPAPATSFSPAARDRSLKPRLWDEETIEEIRAVLERRAKHLDRVHPARQKLEELFVGLVERARTERAATSGAQHGGSTAAFLGGASASGEVDAEQLISSLTDAAKPEAEEEMKTEATAATAGPSGAEDAGDAVIDELLGDLYEDDAPQPEAGRSADVSEEARSEDVDSSVIEGLLGESDSDDDKGKQS